jgi:hypothetical protein
MKKYCLNCGKELIKKPNKKRLNPIRNHCDSTCKTRYNSKKRYYKLKDDPEEMKKRSNRIKKWYAKPENKSKQNNRVLKNYYKNKFYWTEPRFVNNHREKFLNLINKKCICGNQIKVIHHTTYIFNRNWKNPSGGGMDPFNLWEYSQFLIGFCSKKCHMKHHAKLRKIENFIPLNKTEKYLKDK